MFRITPYNGTTKKRNQTYSDAFDLFDDFFHSARGDSKCPVDVKELQNEYVIEAEMPGIKKENIKIAYEHDYLTISVVQNDEVDDQDEHGTYIHKERMTRSFERSIYLESIDPDNIKAKLDSGILTVTAQKQNEVVNKHVVEIE